MMLLAACGGTAGSEGTGGFGSAHGDTGSNTTTSSGTGTGGSGVGTGFGTSSGGGTSTGSGGGGGMCDTILNGTIRDFSPATHPDFEYVIADDRGMVLPDLGMDQKPVYAGNPTTPTTHGKMWFDMWYRDTPNVNVTIPLSIQLMPTNGDVYSYDNQAFFPIDNQGWGNENNPHNYHFTLEIHTQFQYKGGEVFTFIGDDDVWTFINKKLAIDLGGVHGAEMGSVDLDANAAMLGITKGQFYTLDLFFAERHTTDSHFRVDTTIGCFMPPPPPK